MEVEARCHAATAGIDAAIDDMVPVLTKHPNTSILGVLLAAGQPMDSVRGQTSSSRSPAPERAARRHLRHGLALLTHPDQAGW